EPVRRVHVIPERMVDAVGAHLYHDEIVPIILREEMPGELKALARHLVNVSQDFFLVAGAEVAHVEDVFSYDVFDLFLEVWRVSLFAGGIGSEKISHHRSVERLRRIGPWHADNDRALAFV